MVDKDFLAGVFVQVHPNVVVGVHRQFITEITEDGLALDKGVLNVVSKTNAEFFPNGVWIPIFRPEACSHLKSVSVIPKTAIVSMTRVGKKSVPTILCDNLFAKSIINWYAKVGNFVAMPGLILAESPNHQKPIEKAHIFKAATVLPAFAFDVEGDAILWSLTAFDVGSDIFSEPRTKAEQGYLERTNDVLNSPEEYFQ